MIAELSANHNGRLETALKIIEEAKRCGADAIKLQTYSADTITLNSQNEEFMIRGGLWDGQSLYELYQKAQMPWEWHKPLFDHARALDITILAHHLIVLQLIYLKTLMHQHIKLPLLKRSICH